MTSRAVQIAKFPTEGAPANIDLEDEGVVVTTSITSLDFVGSAVSATSSISGAVEIQIDLPEIVDGGNF
jgi:hypothetical protein